MIKRIEFDGMELHLDAALKNFALNKGGIIAFVGANKKLKNTLSEMFEGCPQWGVQKNEYFTGRVRICAGGIASYPQLIDLARGWEKPGRYFYTLMHLLFSQGMLCHIDHEETRDWTRILDTMLERLTDEEYIPREGDDKRNAHMLLFYLNAYAKVATSDASPGEKQAMYELLGDPGKRDVLSIVAAIYYANPRLCSGYSCFAAVAGSLISVKREHYASIFLTAERFARHERNATFDWQSKKQHFYNKMVEWAKEKEQRAELAVLLSVVFPKVEDWDPRNNSFHPIRGKKRPDPGLSEAVKSYVDREISIVEKQLDKEVAMNRQEHMALSEKIGKAKGTTTTVNVAKDGIYNENVEQQHYSLPPVADGMCGLQKGASL